VVIRYFTLTPSELPESRSDVRYFVFSVDVANAMTSLGLAYCYHYNVPYFYKELRHRSNAKMMKTVFFSQPVTFVCYIAVGVFGYLTFGAAVDSSSAGGDIVANYSSQDTAMNVGRLGLFLHFCCVYPILAVSCRRGLHRMIVQYVLAPRRHRDQAEKHQRQHGETDRGSPVRFQVLRGHPQVAEHVELWQLEAEDQEEDPSRPAIMAEAFGLVSLSILCAWVAPGISFVINVTGSLFGLFLMFVGPGLIGLRLFGGEECVLMWASRFLVATGAIFIVSSFYTVVTGE
jgi:hypothetical protein